MTTILNEDARTLLYRLDGSLQAKDLVTSMQGKDDSFPHIIIEKIHNGNNECTDDDKNCGMQNEIKATIKGYID